MVPSSRAIIRPLSRRACDIILKRNTLGRVAFSRRDRIDIQPLHYVLLDGWLYGRTSQGLKLATVARNRWVAFEVDEVDGPFEWRSVVVHGAWYRRTSDSPPIERAGWEAGLAALTQLVPGSFTPDDPVPLRTVLFRIHLTEVTGRVARPGRQTRPTSGPA
jgi:uncharacterized protein